MSQSKPQTLKSKSVLKRVDKAYEGFNGGSQKVNSNCSSLSKSFVSTQSQQYESIYRNYNPNRIRLNNEKENNFSTLPACSSRSIELMWTYENQAKRQDKLGQLESSTSTRSLSLVEKIKILEQKKNDDEPKMKRSEMTEAQKMLSQQRKKNVLLMNQLRNLENQINSKFKNVIKLKKMNKDFGQLYENTQKMYTERVLVKNQFALQCSEFIEELRDGSIPAQISVMRQNELQYKEEMRQLEKQTSMQSEEEQKVKNDIIELEEKLKSMKMEVETLSQEHSMYKFVGFRNISCQYIFLHKRQQKKKQEIEVGYNERMFGCLKQYRQIRILFDQIACIKSEFKSICYIADKKIKTKQVFNYEPYYKIKDKKTIDVSMPERFNSLIQSQSQSQSQISSQMKFSQIQSQLKSQTFKLTALPKYNFILTNEFNPLFGDLNEKLSLELELFLKSSIYKNIKSILSQLSFNSLEYDYVFNWMQNKKSTEMSGDQDDEQSIGFNIFESYADIVRKRERNIQTGNNQNVVYPPNVLVLMGDKDRGAFSCIFQNIEELLQFDNGLLKVKEIQYQFTYLDNDQSETEMLSYQDLLDKFEIELKDDLYKQNICISCVLSISQQDYNPKQTKQISRAEGYKKNVNVIFLNNQTPNKAQFAKQIQSAINKDKILQQRDKVMEKLDPFIRGAEKRILITEIPNLIKHNEKSITKFNLIKDILNFTLGIDTK